MTDKYVFDAMMRRVRWIQREKNISLKLHDIRQLDGAHGISRYHENIRKKRLKNNS